MADQAPLRTPSPASEPGQELHKQSMVKYGILFLTIVATLLPLGFIVQLSLAPFGSYCDWLLGVLLTCGLALFFFLIQPCHICSIYLRYAIPLGFLLAVVISLVKVIGQPLWSGYLIDTWPNTVLVLAATGFFAYLTVQALRGYRYPQPACELAFPLRRGRYMILHGGSTKIINYHVVNPAQRYANDILKLNRFGIRARGLYPKEPGAYCIFGDILYSPCDGVVTRIVDGLPDLIPPMTDRKNVAGNHVIIVSQDTKILLAHMGQGSVLVQAGEQVRRGQPLGSVGNSGNTSEPHLHIHAERGGRPDRFGDGIGVPILFKEHGFLKRNDVFVVGNVPPENKEHA